MRRGLSPHLTLAIVTARRMLLPAVGTLRPGGDPIALARETVRCAECGCTLGEDEAQAVRWGCWSNGVGDVYPYCEDCARRKFAADSWVPALTSIVADPAA